MLKKIFISLFGEFIEEKIKEFFDGSLFVKKEDMESRLSIISARIKVLEELGLEEKIDENSQKINENFQKISENYNSISQYLSRLEEHVAEFESHVHKYEYTFDHSHDGEGGISEPPEPPVPPIEPPVEPPVLEFINFKQLAQSAWASKVNGLRVGYVKVGKDTPLQIVKDNVLYPYENGELRGLDGVAGKRIVLKSGGWFMVYANGTQYAGVANQKIRPFAFDGGILAFLGMEEQIVDGINLTSDIPEKKAGSFLPIYLLYSDVVEYFEPTSGIEWIF